MVEWEVEDAAGAGRAALARGEWAEAQQHFEAALAEREHAEAWEGLGWLAWWLADEDLTFSARDHAYRLYREGEQREAAGRVAAWIAADFREYRGDVAMGRGWLERAHRLLDGLPECADHGWLALIDADFALNVDHDPETALNLASSAAALGRRLAVPDLEAVGLALEGLTLVCRGEFQRGMRRLDESVAIAVGEQLQLPVSSGWAMCCMISACDQVGDFERASKWSKAMREFVARWGGRQLLGVCRTSYGNVLATRGDWATAERELTAAVGDFESARPGLADLGLVRLGQLRSRQGRTEEARRLFERAGPAGIVGLGHLALDEGEAVSATERAERALRRLPGSSLLDRLPGLELLVRALAERGELDASEHALADLQQVARPYPTAYVRGRVAAAVGSLAAAGSDSDRARRAYEDAIDCFEESSAPYEAALARLGLAGVLAGLGRTGHAIAEARAARETFARLGAERDSARADQLLAAPRPPTEDEFGELSPRELDVLRLVARGLSDAEIARTLVLSPHTVHRHVANIRTKLGLPSRAAAVAYAAQAGLL